MELAFKTRLGADIDDRCPDTYVTPHNRIPGPKHLNQLAPDNDPNPPPYNSNRPPGTRHAMAHPTNLLVPPYPTPTPPPPDPPLEVHATPPQTSLTPETEPPTITNPEYNHQPPTANPFTPSHTSSDTYHSDHSSNSSTCTSSSTSTFSDRGPMDCITNALQQQQLTTSNPLPNDFSELRDQMTLLVNRMAAVETTSAQNHTSIQQISRQTTNTASAVASLELAFRTHAA
eukprot:gene5984-12066_t